MQSILIVFGDRTANEVLEAAELGYADQFQSIRKIYFEKEQFLREHVPEIKRSGVDVRYIVGAANALLKREIVEACDQVGWKPIAIYHPAAIVAPSATVGGGAFIGPLAVVSSHSQVGAHAIVHIHSSVGHDVRVGDYSAILPGARLSGNVVVGQRVIVGSNAFVAAGIRVGDDSRVDALTYLNQDLAEGHIASVRAKQPVKRVDMPSDPK